MPTRANEAGIGQESMFPRPDSVGPIIDVNLNGEEQLSMSKFVRVISEHLDLPPSHSDEQMRALADPATIESGLYVPDRARIRDYPNAFMGVIFPSEEYLVVAKSPEQLARHQQAKVRAAQKLDPDKEKVEAAAHRGAAHVLEGYVEQQGLMRGSLSGERFILRSIANALKAPNKRRFTAQNFNRVRTVADLAIFRTVEVAGLTLGWDTTTVQGVRRAVEYELYGYPGHNNRRLKNFGRYNSVAEQYADLRFRVLDIAINKTQDELAKHTPFLVPNVT